MRRLLTTLEYAAVVVGSYLAVRGLLRWAGPEGDRDE